MLLLIAAAIYFADRAVARGWSDRRKPVAARPFPKPMSRATHWQRATAVVERSIVRAADVSMHQAAAARQLEAAEYALHCLLDELGSVMTTSIGSPLAAKPATVSTPRPMPTALAA
jgi:hypothetical protein